MEDTTLTAPASTAELAPLIARQAIADIVTTYCRALDRCDPELMERVFHPDATLEMGGSTGNALELAREQIRQSSAFEATGMHCITNHIALVDGDRARSESYMLAFRRVQGRRGERDFSFGGRLIDAFERRDGQWKISHRVLLHEWDRSDLVVDRHPMAGAPLGYGSRSRDDLSYANFDELSTTAGTGGGDE